jgi:hypothetical protein
VSGTARFEAFASSPPGAAALAAVEVVAIGNTLESLWERLFPGKPPREGRASHRMFGEVDDGVVATIDARRAILFPHGGPAIVRGVLAWLAGHGVAIRTEPPDPVTLYPEARDRVEAHALAAIAGAASPAAIPLLLAQRERWARHGVPRGIDDRSRRLNRLLVAPRVALVGAPNAGKSTLTNALAGREVAIASEIPGTTRDAVSVRLSLDGLVVDWFDTPGVREAGGDAIEREAQRIARTLLAGADLVIAVAEPGGAWPDSGALGGREPDLRIGTKADLGEVAGADAAVSAANGAGLDAFARLVRSRLVSDGDLASETPWAFDPRLIGG